MDLLIYFIGIVVGIVIGSEWREMTERQRQSKREWEDRVDNYVRKIRQS
jgi:hypothetical protein